VAKGLCLLFSPAASDYLNFLPADNTKVTTISYCLLQRCAQQSL